MNLLDRKALPAAIMFAMLAATAAAGCHTVRGAGEDIEQAGEHVQERVDETTDGNPRTP
ncbi:MAG: entericidin A/B family lipoprotein [Caulobacterales bacterium]